MVKQNYTDAEKEAFEKTASTLFSNSYMSAARRLRKGLGGFGSGFLYKADNGKLYIITNKHVVKDAKSVQLTFKADGGDKTISNCNVIAKSDSMDIAVVEFPATETGFVPLSFDADRVVDGTNVWSAGFPGLGDEPAWQLGNGVVSNDNLVNMELTDSVHIAVIQHTAQVDPGSSGGPLLVLKENTKRESGDKSVALKEYKVVGMNTWKAFRRENANFSLMAKDILKVVNNIGATSSSMKNDDEVGLQNQVEKFIESFNKSSIEMSAFISNKMATSLSEDQLTAMLKNISTNANNSLRDGDAVDGLKIIVADNIKSQIRTLSDLKVGSLSTNGDSGTVTFTYRKKQYTSSWEKNSDGWQLTSTDIIKTDVNGNRAVESGFRVLDLDGCGNVSLDFMFPLTDTYYFEDEFWSEKADYTDKIKFGISYAHFFSRFVNWNASFDYGMVERHNTDIVYYNMDNEYTVEETTTDLKYFTLVSGFGAQCPMAVNRFYFAPDVKAQIGFRNGIGNFLHDSDHDMGFLACVEATFNVGFMFSDESIIYIGGGINRKKILSELSDNSLDKLKYFVLRVGYVFD
ncbi:MAG: trypsin-like peptidase domain-containing protein [Paludibacteraceae bacterium]|nr:trypsin-like peptidase domain-containing protein [Paludibacteraceae bacterium]